MEEKTAKTPNAGKVFISQDESGIKLYEHQKKAFDKMTKKIVQSGQYPYKGLLVLPTGGGKTMTAARWISENILDKGIKVLWLAHRHELLEQAKKTFTVYLAYKDIFKNKKELNWRLVSGIHDMAVNIKPDDDIIFASKDSVSSEKSFGYLKNHFLKGQEEIFLVIDEAHHAPAKTYRTLIANIENNIPKFRMLGLTATPFRTANHELGYLAKLFPDDMVYNIDLKSLITLGILAEPKFEEIETGQDFKKDLDEEQIRKINEGFELESIGFDVAKKIADNNERNNLIVNRYVENKEKYGKTIVFAVNKENVIALNKLFKEKGISSDYVMSDTRDKSGIHSISSKENKEKIQRFRKGGDLDVLINVNILTEGTDVPDVQSVFLTRPTKSTILMTQMMGRALRGVNAGGTPDANIVTFIDEWSDKIAWVNPEKLYIDHLDFEDLDIVTRKRITRLIAISKVEEFAILNDKIIDPDKKALIESVDFIDRIPKGVYKFSYPYYDFNDNPIDKVCEILVYDNLETAYKTLIANIPLKFDDMKERVEDITEEQIINFSDNCETEFFSNVPRYPAYRLEDIDDLIRYYLLTGETPVYYEFKDREKYDVGVIAQYIIDNDLGVKAEVKYITEKWNSEKGGWQTFFDFTQNLFNDEIYRAKKRILYPEFNKPKPEKPQEILEDRRYEDMSMAQIREVNPEYEKWLRNRVFEKFTDANGFYYSAEGNYKSRKREDFEIDHIKPRSKGGKTVFENLQLLTWWANRKKGDKYDESKKSSGLIR
ncbi:MAG: DEAD/DEAH box helicase family protein [Bacteroidales bacterium]|nr:DEAD/DEAH box helicase family protein [Bacteroidales bacterium]